VGALLFGRATYDGMAAHWSTATGEIAEFMNSVPKYVFSRTLESADWNNTTLVKDDAAETVAQFEGAARQGPLRLRERRSFGRVEP
jgi:dihydrofolate reductase